MPKREKNAEKQANDDRKHPKRESNAQRAAREDERRTTKFVADALAAIILKRGHVLGMAEIIKRAKLFKGKVLFAVYPEKGSKDTVRSSPIHAATVPADTRHFLKEKPESTQLREASSGRRGEFSFLSTNFWMPFLVSSCSMLNCSHGCSRCSSS